MQAAARRVAFQRSHILLAVCALGLALRLIPSLQNRFHPDEALYASWAMRIASGQDLLLASAPVDKPPLAFYTMAASLFVFGHSEIAARLPNLMASVISIVLVWRWYRGLCPSSFTPALAPERSAGASVPPPSSLAALTTALSPFDIAFGGTAFLDPLMVMWGLAACVAATRGRPGWAGFLLGLSFATKVQGLLFAPLVIGSWKLGTRMNTDNTDQNAISAFVCVHLRPLLRFAAGLATVIALILAWSIARGGTPFWVQQTINYGGIRFAFAGELLPRLFAWLGLFPYLFGPIAGVAIVVGMALLIFLAVTRGAGTRSAAIDLLPVAYALAFLGLHWLLAFPVWDRYLLILAPIGAALMGRSIGLLVGWLGGWLAGVLRVRIRLTNHPTIPLAIIAAMLPFSIQAARSETPIGGDRGLHDGIDQVAAYLSELPAGTVVYDHWLGWELDFYVWGALLHRVYFETPTGLADDLRTFGRTSPRYLVAPGGESLAKIERAIAAEGFGLTPVFTTIDRHGQTSFVVYRVTSRRR